MGSLYRINDTFGHYMLWFLTRYCNVVGHGGGWGYSAHSVEAIRFCADADILLGGLGLFGGRGEYTAKIKVTSLLMLFVFIK